MELNNYQFVLLSQLVMNHLFKSKPQQKSLYKINKELKIKKRYDFVKDFFTFFSNENYIIKTTVPNKKRNNVFNKFKIKIY